MINNKFRKRLTRDEQPPWSLKEFYNRRNWILIQRRTGGLGDILMARMLFENFKLMDPEIKIAFAVPKIFVSVVEDHPFVDRVLDYEEVKLEEYIKNYDITSVCGFTEQKNAPLSSPHRSDIWADWCGIKLTSRNMHLKLSDKELENGRQKAFQYREDQRFSVAFCPYSAIKSKNLEEEQFRPIIEYVKSIGGYIYGLHYYPILNFDAPLVIGRNNREYMAMIAAADYVITVDTSAFHIAGGLDKPQVGVFSWADGKVYGKYYKKWELVQRHRDDGDWDCGPCYTWSMCTKCPRNQIRKPCITSLTADEIIDAFKRLMDKYPYAESIPTTTNNSPTYNDPNVSG